LVGAIGLELRLYGNEGDLWGINSIKTIRAYPAIPLDSPESSLKSSPCHPRTIHQIKSPTAAELELSNHESIAPSTYNPFH